jgi:hypothetical protein
MASIRMEAGMMNETDKLIIWAQMSAEGYPADFIEGLIAALEFDLSLEDPKAEEMLTGILSKARAANHSGLIGDVIDTAFAIKDISEKNQDISRKTEAMKRLSYLADSQDETPLGLRILHRKITEALLHI